MKKQILGVILNFVLTTGDRNVIFQYATVLLDNTAFHSFRILISNQKGWRVVKNIL